MNVKTILATKGKAVITISENQMIKDAIILLKTHNIGALVVFDASETMIGILSERDIIRYAATHDDIFSLPVAEVMTPSPITAIPQDDLHALANIMTESRIRHLPILNDGKLVGIVSIGDVVKMQRDMYKGEVDTLQAQILSN